MKNSENTNAQGLAAEDAQNGLPPLAIFVPPARYLGYDHLAQSLGFEPFSKLTLLQQAYVLGNMRVLKDKLASCAPTPPALPPEHSGDS